METVFEMLDAAGLAARLNVPITWIREYTRRRATDPLPHVRLGHYVRFEFLSPELAAWIARRRKSSGGAR